MTATAAAETMPPIASERFSPAWKCALRHCSGGLQASGPVAVTGSDLLALVSTAREHIRSAGVKRATDVRCWRKTGFAGSQPT